MVVHSRDLTRAEIAERMSVEGRFISPLDDISYLLHPERGEFLSVQSTSQFLPEEHVRQWDLECTSILTFNNDSPSDSFKIEGSLIRSALYAMNSQIIDLALLEVDRSLRQGDSSEMVRIFEAIVSESKQENRPYLKRSASENERRLVVENMIREEYERTGRELLNPSELVEAHVDRIGTDISLSTNSDGSFIIASSQWVNQFSEEIEGVLGDNVHISNFPRVVLFLDGTINYRNYPTTSDVLRHYLRNVREALSSLNLPGCFVEVISPGRPGIYDQRDGITPLNVYSQTSRNGVNSTGYQYKQLDDRRSKSFYFVRR